MLLLTPLLEKHLHLHFFLKVSFNPHVNQFNFFQTKLFCTEQVITSEEDVFCFVKLTLKKLQIQSPSSWMKQFVSCCRLLNELLRSIELDVKPTILFIAGFLGHAKRFNQESRDKSASGTCQFNGCMEACSVVCFSDTILAVYLGQAPQ